MEAKTIGNSYDYIIIGEKYVYFLLIIKEEVN
jgi:hypothetical protein